VFLLQDGVTTQLFLTKFGTVETIQINLGRQETVKVAQALSWNGFTNLELAGATGAGALSSATGRTIGALPEPH